MHNAAGWDSKYEWKAVALLAIGFGLVGIDRFMILPLFPVMAKDLHLDYQDLGNITGILAVAWGIAALFMGRLSDRIGQRRVLIPALVIFSLLAGVSGLAAGAASLMVLRACMGLAEGAYTPASIVATLEASKPERQGTNIGIQQTALPLFGLGFAPILVTQLLKVLDWHWIFAMVSVPGLIVAWLLYRVLRDRPAPVAKGTGAPVAPAPRWTAIFGYRNIWLNMIGMLCWLTCLVVLSALFPNYLVDYLHLGLEQMGLVLAAIGFGGTLGTLLMPALSDRIGRKPVMLVSVLGAAGGVLMLMRTGAEPWALFGWLLFTLFFVFSMICLTVGPISAESVPPALMSTASGAVIGVGEIFGGGAAPAIAGYVAQHFGIEFILHVALAALVPGLLAVLALRETAPVRVARQATEATGNKEPPARIA
jgi:predicted MFS family arabinose efflux permease